MKLRFPTPSPAADAALLRSVAILLALQIRGKNKQRLSPQDLKQAELAVAALEQLPVDQMRAAAALGLDPSPSDR